MENNHEETTLDVWKDINEELNQLGISVKGTLDVGAPLVSKLEFPAWGYVFT